MELQWTEPGLGRSFLTIASILGVWFVACGGTKIDSRGTFDEAGNAPATAGGASGAPNTRGGGPGSGGAATDAGTSGFGGSGTGGVVRASGGFVSASGGAASGASGGNRSGGAAADAGARDAGGFPDARDGSAPIGDPCNFTLSVTTVSYGGNFAPRNVGAIWIEDAAGSFVKTLHTWGGPRLNQAVQWYSVSAGNRVDAISSATRSGHGSISGAWDCTGVSRSPVPHGSYAACIEFEEDVIAVTGRPAHYACEPFLFGTPGATGTWPDQTLFVEMSWAFK